MSKVVVFDFDGTIADSFELFVTTLNKILAKPRPLTPDEISQLRGKQIKEIMKQVGIKSWQIPGFVIKGRREIGKNFDSVTIFDPIPSLIAELSKRGYVLFILSTNAEGVIRDFLKKNELEGYFKSIYASIGLTGKTRYLKRLINEHGYTTSEVIYIGDEVRDIDASHKAGITCISVSWGYSTKDSLDAHTPDYVVTTTDEILEILN